MKIFERKIQPFAKYSYAITLPIHWIKKNKLDVRKKDGTNGKLINIFENPDGSLQIFLKKDTISESEKILDRINLNEYLGEGPDSSEESRHFIKDKTIQMLLISFYMNGSYGVEILYTNPIPKEIISQVEHTQQKLLFNWNLTILSSRKIEIKTIFDERTADIFEKDIPRFLRDSFSILLSVIEVIIESLNTDEYMGLENIREQDSKIDRYYFFIVRQIRTIFENPKINRPLNFSHKKIVDLRLIAKSIEEAGDLFKECSTIIFNFHEFLDIIDFKPYLLKYFKVIYKIYSDLADKLRASLSQHHTSIGMNEQIMALIESSREYGKVLGEEWTEIARDIPMDEIKGGYMEYFQGAVLIHTLEEIFAKIFDFTNLLF